MNRKSDTVIKHAIQRLRLLLHYKNTRNFCFMDATTTKKKQRKLQHGVSTVGGRSKVASFTWMAVRPLGEAADQTILRGQNEAPVFLKVCELEHIQELEKNTKTIK